MALVNRIRTNHYNLNESLARKNYIDSARCECGAEVQNIGHIVWGCNLYDDERSRKLKRRKIKYPYDIEKWLKDCDLDPIKIVWENIYMGEYLNSIGKIV